MNDLQNLVCQYKSSYKTFSFEKFFKNYGTNSQKKFHLKKGVFINKSINK